MKETIYENYYDKLYNGDLKNIEKDLNKFIKEKEKSTCDYNIEREK